MVEKNPSEFDPEEYLTDILPPGLMTPDLPEDFGVSSPSIESELVEDVTPIMDVDDFYGGVPYDPSLSPYDDMGRQEPAILTTPDGPIEGTKENFIVSPGGDIPSFSIRPQSKEDTTKFEGVLESGNIDEMINMRSDTTLLSLSGDQVKALDMGIARVAVEQGYGGNPPLDISLQSVWEGSADVIDYLGESFHEGTAAVVGIEGMPGSAQEGDWRGGQLVGINDFKTWLVKEKGLTSHTASRIANSSYEYIVDREEDQPLALTVSEEGFIQRNVQTAYNALMFIPSTVASMGYVAGKDIKNHIERVPARDGSKVQDRWYRVEEHMAYSVPDVRVAAATLQLMKLGEEFDQGSVDNITKGFSALLTMSHELQMGPMELYEQIVNAKSSGELTEDDLLSSFLSRSISSGYKEALQDVLGVDKEHPFMDLPEFLWSDETLSEKAPFEFARKIKSWLKRAKGYHEMGTRRAKSPKLQQRIDQELDPQKAQEVANRAASLAAPRLPEGISPEDVPYNWDLIRQLYEHGYDESGYGFFAQDPDWAGVRTAPAEMGSDAQWQASHGVAVPHASLIESLEEAGFSDIHDIRDITEEEARERFRLLKVLEEAAPEIEGEVKASVGEDVESYVRVSKKKRKTPTSKYTPPLVEGLSAATIEDLETPEEKDEYFVRVLSLLGAGAPWEEDEIRHFGDKILKNTLTQDAADKFAAELRKEGSPELKNFVYNYFGHQAVSPYAEHLKMKGLDPASFDPNDPMSRLEYALKMTLDFDEEETDWRDSFFRSDRKGTNYSWYEGDTIIGPWGYLGPFHGRKSGFVGPDPSEYEGPGAIPERYDPGHIIDGEPREGFHTPGQDPMRRAGAMGVLMPFFKSAYVAGALIAGGHRALEEDNFLRALNTAIANAQASREDTRMYSLLEKGYMGEYYRDNPQQFATDFAYMQAERMAESTGSSYLQSYIRAIEGGIEDMPHHFAVSTWHLGKAAYTKLKGVAEGEEPSYTEDELEAIDRVQTLPVLNLMDVGMAAHVTGKTLKKGIRSYRKAEAKLSEWRKNYVPPEDLGPGQGTMDANASMEKAGVEKVANLTDTARDTPPLRVWEPAPVAQEVPTPVVHGEASPLKMPLDKASLHHEFGSPDASVFTDVLYRETNIEGALEIIPRGGREIGTDLYFSNVPELALGQGSNRGVFLEFDAPKSLPHHNPLRINKSKPGWEQSYAMGSAEFRWNFYRGDHTNGYWEPNLRQMTIRPDAQVEFRHSRPRMQQTINALKKRGWKVENLEDGSIVVTRPVAARKHPAVEAGIGKFIPEGPIRDFALEGFRESAQAKVDHHVNILKSAVAEGYRIETPDGMAIAPRHLDKIVNENPGIPGRTPSVEGLGVEPQWKWGLEEGTPQTTGTPLISQPQNVSVSKLSGAANARNMALLEEAKGNPKAAEAYRDVATSYEQLTDARTDVRRAFDDVSPNRQGVDQRSVAIRKQISPVKQPLMSTVILDVVGEKPMPSGVKNVSAVKNYTSIVSEKWGHIKKRLEFLKTKDGTTNSKVSLDLIETDISRFEFGDVKGNLSRYRAGKTPVERAEELILRGYTDPVLYKILGLKNSEIFVSVNKASEMIKTGNGVIKVEVANGNVSKAKNIPYDSVRVEELDFKTATERAKSGLSNPSDYSDLSLTADQLKHTLEVASAERPKIYFGVVAPKPVAGDMSIGVDPTAPPTGRPAGWTEVAARAVFGDKPYEAATGAIRPIVSGGKITGLQSGRDIPMAMAEFISRPFAILNFPSWGRDIIGKFLADAGAGKGTLGPLFEKLWIRMASKSTTLGRPLLQGMEAAEALPHAYAAQVERTSRLLRGKPEELVQFQFEDLVRALKEAELADAAKPYGGQFQNRGDMVATQLEANHIATALKTMDDGFVIEEIGGVPVYLKDFTVKEINFKGQWMPLESMNKLVNDGVYNPDYVAGNNRGFRYRNTKPIEDLTSKQRFALTLANDYIRFDDVRLFDATAKIIGGIDTLIPHWKASGLDPKHIIKFQSDTIRKLSNWMGEFYDDRGVFTTLIDTMKKVGENSNDANALAALQLIDERLGMIVPGAKAGIKQKASEIFQKYVDNPEFLAELDNIQGAKGSQARRFFRTGLWRNELSWNEKIQHGLWDYNEAVTKVHQNQGELIGQLQLINYAREKGLVRSPAELMDTTITPPEMKGQFVQIGDMSLVTERAQKYIGDGPHLADSLKGMWIHKHFNDALVRQVIMNNLGRRTVSRIHSNIKLGMVLTTGGMIRNKLQNNWVMPALTEHATYTGMFDKEALSMIRAAQKGKGLSPEFETASSLGMRRMARSQAERIANDTYIEEQARFAEEAKKWVIPLASRELGQFTKGAEMMFESLEGGPAGKFMEHANFQRMKSPNFLGTDAPSVRAIPGKLAHGAKKAVKGTRDAAAEVYGMVDDLDKLAYYLELTRKHGYTPRQAMDAVQDVLINFNDTAPMIDSISMNPWAIIGGSTFVRWSWKSGMKWGPHLSGVNAPYAFAMMNGMTIYQKGLATTLGIPEDELKSMMRRNDEVYYPGKEVIKSRMHGGDPDTQNLKFGVGMPAISMGTFSLGGGFGYRLDKASRMPSGMQQKLATIAAFLPTEQGTLADLLFSTGENLNGNFRYLRGDEWSDVFNGGALDLTASIIYGGGKAAAKSVSPTYFRDYLRMNEGHMDEQTFLLRNIGLGSVGVGSVYEQSVMNTEDFTESMNAIKSTYDDLSIEDQQKPKNVLIRSLIIDPYFGAEGEGLYQGGKWQPGLGGDMPIKPIAKDKIERQRTRQFVSSVPVILHYINKGDFSWFEDTNEGRQWLSGMMEKQGFRKIENPDGTFGFVPVPQ